jgi:hypothetical protein
MKPTYIYYVHILFSVQPIFTFAIWATISAAISICISLTHLYSQKASDSYAPCPNSPPPNPRIYSISKLVYQNIVHLCPMAPPVNVTAPKNAHLTYTVSRSFSKFIHCILPLYIPNFVIYLCIINSCLSYSYL